MTRINREYLDRGLQEVGEYARVRRESLSAHNDIVSSVAETSVLRERAKISVGEKIGRSIAIAILLIAIAVCVYIVSLPLLRWISLSSEQIEDSSISLAEQTEANSNSTPQQFEETPSSTPSNTVSAPAISLQHEAQEAGSGSCYNDLSYASVCTDEYVYPNGSTYYGEWLNGQPNGDGRLTFSEGGAIEGRWVSGTLESGSVLRPEGRSPMMSVTVFASEAATNINLTFVDVVVGHNFDSSVDETWSEAYCYLSLIDGDDNVRVELSFFPSFQDGIIMAEYEFDRRYTREEFLLAQDLCPYRRVGF